MPSEPKTVRVRIPVAVTATGDWYAHGYNDESDDEKRDEAIRIGSDYLATAPFHIVWIEADVPLPADIVVEGQVRE
jgi:hypothetical protein